MGNTNIIELNGKRYDAVSGALVEDIKRPAVVKVAPKPESLAAAPHGTARALDGIVRHSSSHHTKVHDNKTPLAVVHQHQPIATSSATSHRQVAPKHQLHHVAAHKPDHAKTLMRASVKKPESSSKALAHIQAPIGSALSKAINNLPATHSSVDIERLSRAQQASKSSSISRFGLPSHTKFTKHVRPMAVHTAPPITTPTKHQPLSVFETAIAQAVSHQQPAHQPAKRQHFTSRAVNFIAGGVALLLIGGFIAYQNVPNIDIRIASSRAGFQATMPGFRPSGFAFSGPIRYSSGEVTIGFRSTSDTRSYNILEHTSSWDSQTLLDSFVATTQQPYQTIQNAGRTIYIYGNGNATWVNGNIWYQVVGNSSLTTDQLVNIATSM